MRASTAAIHPSPARSCTFRAPMATRSKSARAAPASATPPAVTSQQQPGGNSMFTKLIIVVILTAITAFVPHLGSYAVWVFFIGLIVAFVIEGVRIVPQQFAYVVERLGKFHAVLEPGLNLIIPFLDRVAYMHSLKEVPLDVPEQVCITKDNTQLGSTASSTTR